MYRALQHQCSIYNLLMDDNQVPSHLALRQMAAEHIQSRQTEFAPFIVNADSCTSSEEQMSAYMEGVRGNEWGSQVELQALAEALGVHIQVCSWFNNFAKGCCVLLRLESKTRIYIAVCLVFSQVIEQKCLVGIHWLQAWYGKIYRRPSQAGLMVINCTGHCTDYPSQLRSKADVDT